MYDLLLGNMMKKYLVIVLTLVVLLSACTSGKSPASTSTQPAVGSQQVPTENLTLQTQLAQTSQIQPTSTAAPTQIPVRFDQTGFRKFAVMRDYFDGLADFMKDRTYTEFSSTLSPSGDKIAIAGCFGSVSNLSKCETEKSGFLVVLDTENGKLLNEIPVGNSWPGKADFLPDGKSLIYATNGYKIAVWDLVNNQPGHTFFEGPAPDTNYYPDVVSAPDGSSVAAVVEDTLYVWDLSGTLLFQAPAYKRMISAGLAYSADGSRLTFYSPNHTGVDIYKTADWTLVQRIPFDQIHGSAISPDGRLIAATHQQDETVTVWNVDSGEKVAHLDPGHLADSIQFNPAGDMLVVAGMGNLETQDSYSSLGTLFDTQSWDKIDTLYSFLSDGRIEFNQDGSIMAVLGGYGHAIWALPDEKLQSGYEMVQQFQSALSTGDYAAAAALFEPIAGDEEYLVKMGFDLNDPAASFERLCQTSKNFCHPVSDLAMMGYDGDTMVFLVRLKDPNGGVFTSPKGAQVIYFYLYPNAEGQPRVAYPPMDN
jgi:WD40 repeat protein